MQKDFALNDTQDEKMNLNISILQTASALAKYSERRHRIIAENIANSDTPNYKAQDIKPFSAIYEQAQSKSNSLAELINSAEINPINSTTDPNGNSVSLEEQMFAASKTVGDHDMAILVYRKTLDLMKLAIGKNI